MDVLLKALGLWVVILVLAVGNAAVREKGLEPRIGAGRSLPASGALLCLVIFLVSLVSMPWIGASSSRAYGLIGLLWFALTLSFDLLFGRFVTGKTWRETLAVLDVRRGNLFVLVLAATLLSPWLGAKLQGLI